MHHIQQVERMYEMKKDLQVGIIGASADRGWAKAAHVPAVQGLAGLHLAAVVSGGQAKSDAAAKAFGARVGYADAKALFADAEIDIVSVCVKVPDHRELVLAALAAGKHIYCEWPLGRSLAESEELAAAAGAAGVHVAIGLQTRRNSVARKAREMIVAGAIGRLLSARIVSSTVAFGPKVEAAMIFAENAVNGATLVTIQGAHTLDLAIAVLGPAAGSKRADDDPVPGGRGGRRGISPGAFDARPYAGAGAPGGWLRAGGRSCRRPSAGGRDLPAGGYRQRRRAQAQRWGNSRLSIRTPEAFAEWQAGRRG